MMQYMSLEWSEMVLEKKNLDQKNRFFSDPEISTESQKKIAKIGKHVHFTSRILQWTLVFEKWLDFAKSLFLAVWKVSTGWLLALESLMKSDFSSWDERFVARGERNNERELPRPRGGVVVVPYDAIHVPRVIPDGFGKKFFHQKIRFFADPEM